MSSSTNFRCDHYIYYSRSDQVKSSPESKQNFSKLKLFNVLQSLFEKMSAFKIPEKCY